MDRLLKLFAMAGGSAAALSAGMQPTGSATADFVVLLLVGAAISSAIAVSPPAIWAAIAAMASLASGPLGMVGQLITVGGAVFGWRRHGALARDRGQLTDADALVASVVGVGATVSLFHLRNVVVDHSSAVMVAVVMICVFVVAIAGLTQSNRRKALGGVIVCSLAAIGISIAAAVSIVGLRADVASASTTAQDGALLFRKGQTEKGLNKFDEAQAKISAIEGTLHNGWPRLAVSIPLAGQNIRALQTSSANASRLVVAVQELGRSSPLEQLLHDGSVDLSQVDSLGRSLTDIKTVLERSGTDLAAARSPWLAPKVRDEMTEFGDEVEELANTVADLSRFVEILPGLLGADSPRHYLVLIGNPGEARELGGFAGGYAVLTADAGSLSVVRSGRAPQLNHTPTTHDVLTGDYPQRFLEHKPWLFGQNYTAMADLGTLTKAIAELFPAMGGQPIDGLLYLDPYALEALIGITGDVELPQHGLTLTGSNTAQFFVFDQYETIPDKVVRTKVFDALIATFFERLSGELAIDTNRAGGLVTAVREGRLGFATTNTNELEVLSNVGLARSFGHDQVGDFLAVSHLNAGPNKLDAYLRRDIRYEVAVDPATGNLSATLIIDLTNNAPPGLPSYVTGNRRDLPEGTNRAMLVVHTPHQIASRSVGPEPVFDRSFREFGLWRHEQLVIIAPGASETVRFELRGRIAPSGDYALAVAHQPLVTTDDLTVVVSNPAAKTAPFAEFSTQLRSNSSFEVLLDGG